MAENTPISRKFLGNTTEELSALHGKEKQLVIDTVKNTAVVMDGSTMGGHPLAKEAVKIKSGTDGIKINDGTESNLASDITITADPSVCITLHDGQIDFDDPEQIEEITENLPNGQLVASDCCDNCPDDAVYINGNWNTEEWITESGPWTAPVTGWYEVMVIGGGEGGLVFDDRTPRISATGGASGEIYEGLRYYNKGQIIPVTIGAGGVGIIVEWGTYTTARYGGDTLFDDITCRGQAQTGGSWKNITPGKKQQVPIINWTSIDNVHKNAIINSPGCYYGDNRYADNNSHGIPTYGSGGSAIAVFDATSILDLTQTFARDGYQGAVRLRYYDAAKDKNISIDMASSVTIKELQAQLIALSARVRELENE